MNHMISSDIVVGYLLLPRDRKSLYRGVDRTPFQPLLIDSEIISPDQNPTGQFATWNFYPPGWRRDAYRLIEEHCVQCDLDGCYLISDYAIALSVRQIILGPVGEHEIIKVRMVDLELVQILGASPVDRVLGYDAAYPGGDWYSAVKNSLECNLLAPEDRWLSPYLSMLNQYQLFDDPLALPNFVTTFRTHVLSEADSRFVGIELSFPAPEDEK